MEDLGMATVEAQQKWRYKNKFVKSQLNIMARMNIHEYLEEIAATSTGQRNTCPKSLCRRFKL